MQSTECETAVVPVTDLKGYFLDSLRQAADREQLQTDGAVIVYLGDMLVAYSRSEHLYDHTENGLIRRPLVDLYRMALETDSRHERQLFLQKMGDVALFVAGILPESLERSLVDVDYYISMGSTAYGALGELGERDRHRRAQAGIFHALADNFDRFVDLLNRIVEHAPNGLGQDIIRLYDTWSRTGSRRLHRRLVRLGITPQTAGVAH